MNDKDKRIAELMVRLADTEADSAQLISEIRLRRTAEAKLARGRECIGHLIDAVDAIQREASKVCGGLPPMISWHWIKDSYVEIIKESRSVLSDTTPPLAIVKVTPKIHMELVQVPEFLRRFPGMKYGDTIIVISKDGE